MTIDCCIDEKDVILAKNEKGEEYFVIGMEDNDPTWSFNCGHPGKLYTWDGVHMGDKHYYVAPDNCVLDYFTSCYWIRTGESQEDYLNRLRNLWRLVLEHIPNVKIVPKEEFCKKYWGRNSTVDASIPYSALAPYYARYTEDEDDDSFFREYPLNSNDPKDFTEDECKEIYYLCQSFSLDELYTVLEYSPDIAVKKLYIYDDRMGLELVLEDSSEYWGSGTCGIFICTKEEWDLNTPGDNWKEDYEECIKSYLKEWYWIRDGNSWGFRHAKVSDLLQDRRIRLEQALNELKEVDTSSVDCIYNTLESGCYIHSTGVRNDIYCSEEGSCWGFVRDSYKEALQDYLEGYNLEYVKVMR